MSFFVWQNVSVGYLLLYVGRVELFNRFHYIFLKEELPPQKQDAPLSYCYQYAPLWCYFSSMRLYRNVSSMRLYRTVGNIPLLSYC